MMKDNPDPREKWRALHLRTALLAAGLIGMKILLMADFSEHLYQSHWKYQRSMPGSFDYFNAVVFGLLAFGGLFGCVVSARNMAVRRLRLWHGWLSLSGVAFIILTFREVNKNYLYAVGVDGFIGWFDLVNYLILDFFFRPPYLAVYLIVAGIVYYGCWRSGREARAGYGLAGLGALYYFLNLDDFVRFGPELLFLNGLGAIGFVAWLRGGVALKGSWYAFLALLVCGGYWLFEAHSYYSLTGNAYLNALMLSGLALFGGANLILRSTRTRSVFLCFQPMYGIAWVALSNHSYPFADNFNHFILYALSLPQYFLHEALVVGAMFLVFKFWARGRSGRAFAVFDALALGLIGMAAIDYRLTQVMGVRLDWRVIVMSDHFGMIWGLAKPHLPALAAALGFGAAVYYGLLILCGGPLRPALTQWMRRRGSFSWEAGAYTIAVSVTALLSFESDKARGYALSHILRTSPLVYSFRHARFEPDEFLEKAKELDMTLLDHGRRPRSLHPDNDLNVLLIVLESSYNKYLSLFGAEEETQPLMKKYRDRMEIFPNFYSNFPNSNSARFSIFSGLYSTKEYVSYINPKIPAESMFEILSREGYQTAIFDSSFRDYTRFEDYIGHRDLDLFYAFDDMPGRENYERVQWGLDERATLNAILRQLERYAGQDQPFLLTYLPVAPHMPYDLLDERFKGYPVGAPSLDGDYSGKYKNQLLFMDWVVAQILGRLEQLDLLDRTLVIVTNDHGEMVGEDGGPVGHGWSLAPELTNTPLIVMDPRRKGHRINPRRGSQIDVLPTVLHLLNAPVPKGELYQGESLFDEDFDPERPIYLNSYNDRALITGSRYYLEQHFIQGFDEGVGEAVFAIRNEGAKTLFEKVDETYAGDVSLDRRMDLFEAFQNSLIMHYGHYKRLAKEVWSKETGGD